MTHGSKGLLWSLFAVAAVAGCDPVWKVENPATAEPALTDSCIEAGLRTLDPKLNEGSHAVDGSRFDYIVVVPATGQSMHVKWEPAKATVLELSRYNAGQHPPAGAVEAYRAGRDTVVASIEQACSAKVTLGPETCQRCN